MKKFVLFLFTVCLSIISVYWAEINGSYINKNIVYSFVKDSLYIDEIGIEGDAYVYDYAKNDSTVKAYNDFDEINFKVLSNDNDTIRIKYIDSEKIYTFVKIDNYDIHNMKINEIKWFWRKVFVRKELLSRWYRIRSKILTIQW